MAAPLPFFAFHAEGAALGYGKAAGLALLKISKNWGYGNRCRAWLGRCAGLGAHCG